MSKRSRFTNRAPRRALAVAALLAAACTGSPGAPGATDAAQGVSVSVSPRTAAVPRTAEQRFAATVTGTADTSVSWQVSEGGCGTVSTAGLYTAPGAGATCHVVVTSNADPTKRAVAVVTVEAAPPPPATADTVWEPLKIGAGGWVTGIDADEAGTTFVLRTDTYGGYVGDGQGPWQQVMSATSMPAPFLASFTSGTVQSLAQGVYELRVAPSDGNRLYMAFQSGMYLSADRGSTWIELATFPDVGRLDPNDTYRYWGEKMAVDPANPDVVYVGSVTSGLWVTTDAGLTWSQVPTAQVPIATHGAGFTGIVFDASSGTTGGRTRTLYACSNGNGVYRSTDAGASWSLLAGGPTTVHHAVVAKDGVYYAVNMTNTVYRNTAGTWSTSADAGIQLHSIATDPRDPARIIGGRDSGHLVVSTDRGASWGGGPIWTMTRQAPDVGWLAFAKESYMSSGGILFDPLVPDKLWFVEGIGVWYSTAPENRAGTAWQAHSAGIEQLVGRDVCVPPGSPNVITAGMDRSIFVAPRTNAAYPSRYGTEPTPSASLIAAWSVDYAANDPSTLVAIINRGGAGEPELSGYSLDGGATWTKFPVQPGSGGQSGDVVATSVDNVIAVIGNKYAYRSTDRGASWTKLVLPGDSGADTANLHCGYNCKKHVLAIDGADSNTVYLYFYKHGVYRSTDAGATWTLASANAFDAGNMYWQVKLRAVPGKAGHLFLTAGQAGGTTNLNPHNTSLWRSKDGGATWTTVPGMAEPYDVALGKAAPGASYPTIYVVGWYGGKYGIWRSTDDAATWASIGAFPFGSVDQINVIAASQDVYGDLYAVFQGSGWGYGKLKPVP